MEEQARSDVLWYVKRLSGNDTLANGSHQAGPYIPKDALFEAFPPLNSPKTRNPRVQFALTVDSHGEVREARAIWYNNKLHGNPKGGRNEARITHLGGERSPLLNPNSTGALAVFAFHREALGRPAECHVWLCETEAEEKTVENCFGTVEPGDWLIRRMGKRGVFDQVRTTTDCWLAPEQMPQSWLKEFPSGIEIAGKAKELCPAMNARADARLLQRRKCEFDLFRSIENAVELPTIQRGFDNLQDFMDRAQTILQRRKARAGRSLELQIREILLEENLREKKDFAYQAISERNKRPDFLFPSEKAYRDANFPSEKLRMLAVKTTCRDRWRQILNEAKRIPVKHLFTLQEGVSEAQFGEMQEAGVRLVVPKSLHDKYPKSTRKHLQGFEDFLTDVRKLRE